MNHGEPNSLSGLNAFSRFGKNVGAGQSVPSLVPRPRPRPRARPRAAPRRRHVALRFRPDFSRMPHYRGNQIPGVRLAAAQRIQRAVRRRRARRAGGASAAEVRRNTKDIKLLKSVGYQYAPFIFKQSGTISNDAHVSLLTAPNLWSGVYRMHGVSNDDLPRQYDLKTMNFDWACQCEAGDVGNLWFQIMLVSLKRKMASQVLARTVRLSTLTENLDYTAMSAGTTFTLQGNLGYKMNPDLYTVHYHSGQRRIGESTMTADTPVTNVKDGTATGSCTIKFPRTFKNDETSSAGFKELTYAQIEPRQHLYLVVFSNTSGSVVTGGELFHTFRCQFNGHCNNPN